MASSPLERLSKRPPLQAIAQERSYRTAGALAFVFGDGHDNQAATGGTGQGLRCEPLHQQGCDADAEDDAKKRQLERRAGEGRGDHQHDEADLLRFLDGRPKTYDRQRAEQAQGQRQGELDGDEDRGHRDAQQRERPMGFAAGRSTRVEIAVEPGNEQGARQREEHEEHQTPKTDVADRLTARARQHPEDVFEFLHAEFYPFATIPATQGRLNPLTA